MMIWGIIILNDEIVILFLVLISLNPVAVAEI